MKSCWKFAIETFFAGKNVEIDKPKDKAREMEKLCYDLAKIPQVKPEAREQSELPKKPTLQKGIQNKQFKIIVGMMEIFAKQFSETKEGLKEGFEKIIRKKIDPSRR